MTAERYIKDKILVLLLNGLGIFLLSLYLLAVGNGTVTIALIVIIWFVIIGFVFVSDYQKRRRYFQKIDEIMADLDQPYLIQEVLEQSWRLEDQLYREILRQSNKAVMERIYQLEEEQKEYREFIEGWIHEVKLPITGMRLATHNKQSTEKQRIERYLTEIENMVEQALFYARSEQVYKDYIIAETDLEKVILKVIAKNKYLLIHNQISVEALSDECIVYTDRKWLEFILTQIVINAAKYKQGDNGEIIFRTEKLSDGVKLIVRDAGIGIPETEQGRIFDKGFTGSNGREQEKSTGIGLYLCQKLCCKLELKIAVQSKIDEYTEIHLTFPANSYLSKL